MDADENAVNFSITTSGIVLNIPKTSLLFIWVPAETYKYNCDEKPIGKKLDIVAVQNQFVRFALFSITIPTS
jgi:hypothetical protein